MKHQLHIIEDETACIEEDEGEDLIKSINSLLNKGKLSFISLRSEIN